MAYGSTITDTPKIAAESTEYTYNQTSKIENFVNTSYHQYMPS